MAVRSTAIGTGRLLGSRHLEWHIFIFIVLDTVLPPVAIHAKASNL